jgi:PhnB protein
MKMNPYLSFKGNCEAAFKYYEQHLGGEMGGVFRYAGTSLSGTVPEDWSDKIMHGSITIGGQTLQAADVSAQQYEAPQGFSLTLQIKSTADAERMFEALADGGQVRMPLEKTFWAERFGMVVDRFGVPWIINCEG